MKSKQHYNNIGYEIISYVQIDIKTMCKTLTITSPIIFMNTTNINMVIKYKNGTKSSLHFQKHKNIIEYLHCTPIPANLCNSEFQIEMHNVGESEYIPLGEIRKMIEELKKDEKANN